MFNRFSVWGIMSKGVHVLALSTSAVNNLPFSHYSEEEGAVDSTSSA